MVQPQPGCVNLRHAGRTNHHIHHHMTLMPYHSHHTLQKQVRRMTCSTKVALRKPLQRESNGGPAGRSAGGGSRGEPPPAGLRATASTHDLDLLVQSADFCTQLVPMVIPAGRDMRMHNRERTQTNLLSHAAQSTRSSFNPL